MGSESSNGLAALSFLCDYTCYTLEYFLLLIKTGINYGREIIKPLAQNYQSPITIGLYFCWVIIFRVLIEGHHHYDVETENAKEFWCYWYNQRHVGEYPPPLSFHLTKVDGGWHIDPSLQLRREITHVAHEIDKELLINEDLKALL